VEGIGTTTACNEIGAQGNKIVSAREGGSQFMGLPSNRCRRCGKHLSASSSVQCGYGPKCLIKVRSGDLRRSKVLKTFEPKTITDPVWAERVNRAIYSLVHKITPESAGWNARCAICGTTIQEMPLESFDHDGGLTLPGYGKPQWFYLHDDHNDLAIWKLRIYDADILAELDRMYPGQVPGYVKPAATIAEAPHRCIITEQIVPENTYDNLESAIKDKGFWTPADERRPALGARMEIARVGSPRPIVTEEPLSGSKILTTQPIDNRIICADTTQAAAEASVRGRLM